MTELDNLIASTIATWSGIVCERVRSRWDNLSNVPGESHINTGEIQFNGNTVMQAIVSFGFKAWACEFGTGHLLDTDNPYLDAYKRTDMWNPEREADGNEFIGRAKGDTIYRPDGTTDVSTGKAEGMRLEHQLSKGYPAYKAIEPMHVIREECQDAFPELCHMLNTAVEQYFKGLLNVELQIYL